MITGGTLRELGQEALTATWPTHAPSARLQTDEPWGQLPTR